MFAPLLVPLFWLAVVPHGVWFTFGVPGAMPLVPAPEPPPAPTADEPPELPAAPADPPAVPPPPPAWASPAVLVAAANITAAKMVPTLLMQMLPRLGRILELVHTTPTHSVQSGSRQWASFWNGQACSYRRCGQTLFGGAGQLRFPRIGGSDPMRGQYDQSEYSSDPCTHKKDCMSIMSRGPRSRMSARTVETKDSRLL